MLYSRHIARRHPRLLLATAGGITAALLLPATWPTITRVLTGWNCAVWSYLVLMGWLMLRASHARVRAIAEQEDESAQVVLAILSIAAVASLAAITLELATLKGATPDVRIGRYLLTVATVLGSWFLVGTIFTFHYAHMFYRAPATARPLRFPDDEQTPDYWDFLYFSFTIAVAAQTSDVTVNTRSMRKAVLAQSVLSFLFNAAILGMSVNIAAGLM